LVSILFAGAGISILARLGTDLAPQEKAIIPHKSGKYLNMIRYFLVMVCMNQ
jgi:hypothetical protein